MAQDFFGHNRTIKTGKQLASSEYARIQMGGTTSLAQQVQASYAQEIKPVYEIGSPSVMYVAGHASGTVSVSRLVGCGGFFQGLGAGGACGTISAISISGGAGACSCGGGGVNFDGGILEEVSLNITAGTIEMVEGARVRVGSMSAG